MADRRKHRGPHPEDRDLFGTAQLPALCDAVEDLCWLFDRGYGLPSALKLVGDRHGLRERQRIAVRRSACSMAQLQSRRAKHVALANAGEVWVDGFNLLTTVEAALGGGVLLVGRDGCCRDMASMHGTYRKVEQTRPALERIGRWFDSAGTESVHWLLDQPVSNSGRLAGVIREVAANADWNWTVELVPDPDHVLSQNVGVVITADSEILDSCNRWSNAALEIVSEIPDAWLCSIGGPG